jgi:hypothetical protein
MQITGRPQVSARPKLPKTLGHHMHHMQLRGLRSVHPVSSSGRGCSWDLPAVHVVGGAPLRGIFSDPSARREGPEKVTFCYLAVTPRR